MFGNRRQQTHPKTMTWICWEMRAWNLFLVRRQTLRVLLNIYLHPPRPQPLHFEALSLKTPAKTVPPTPGTALQQKIGSKLEKSLGSQFNIQLQQQMGAFQASTLEAMKSLRDEMQSIKKSKEVELDQSSTSASKPGPSKQSDNLPPNTGSNTLHSECTNEAMELDVFGPSLAPRFGDAQSEHGSDPNHGSHHHSDIELEQPEQGCLSRAKKHSDKRKHKVRAKYISQLSPSEEDQPSAHKKRSSQPPRAPSELDQPQNDPHPLFYREVAMADLPSQYAEEVETFRHILDLPDPRETMPRSCLGLSLPRSSTSVLGLDDKKGQQELRPRGPSAMLPLSSHIKDAFDKFEQDFLASNLPEGKYIKPPPSTAKWYKVGQSCFEDKMQELNTDFSKICISPKPSGAPMVKVPLPVLKELEHQARQNLSAINFTAAFAKSSSPCNTTMEKCQHSLKSTFKKVKTQI